VRRLLSPPGRCITLAALSGARPSIGLASETGSRCERVIAAPSRHCPRNGKRSEANTHVTAPLTRRGKAFAGHRHSRVRRPAWHRAADTFAVGELGHVV
jgi:hypothetical protein